MAKNVLDVCCGSRMFWFDRANPNCVFVDKRREQHALTDMYSPGGTRSLVIEPDVVGDFTNLPFAANSFSVVVFDPPHLLKGGSSSWLVKKYGKLTEDWRDNIQRGFAECFRVLKREGTLIFKWNETDIPLSAILLLTSVKPLFGSRGGKAMKTHWVVFIKD